MYSKLRILRQGLSFFNNFTCNFTRDTLKSRLCNHSTQVLIQLVDKKIIWQDLLYASSAILDPILFLVIPLRIDLIGSLCVHAAVTMHSK
jgi:hypothetical protein